MNVEVTLNPEDGMLGVSEILGGMVWHGMVWHGMVWYDDQKGRANGTWDL